MLSSLNVSNNEKVFNLEKPLLKDMLFGFDLYEQGSQYEVPVYFIMGDNDWITPDDMAAAYYESVEAPDKNIILIENTGHSLFVDDPEVFDEAVRSVLDNINLTKKNTASGLK